MLETKTFRRDMHHGHAMAMDYAAMFIPTSSKRALARSCGMENDNNWKKNTKFHQWHRISSTELVNWNDRWGNTDRPLVIFNIFSLQVNPRRFEFQINSRLEYKAVLNLTKDRVIVVWRERVAIDSLTLIWIFVYSRRKQKKRNSERDIWRNSWGSSHSQKSSCSLQSNCTTNYLGKDDFWLALQPNYNYIMDTKLLDTCREARGELEHCRREETDHAHNTQKVSAIVW